MIAKEDNYDLAIAEWDNLIKQSKFKSKARRDAQKFRAGLYAEKSMAFFLKSYFQNLDGFQVYNNLKFECGDITAQIDHLVITRYSIYFIESKSISEEISVNERGEWSRIYNGKTYSIDSPVEQVKRQQRVLYDIFNLNASEISGKFLGKQLHITGLLNKFCYVAISDRGKISGAGLGQFDNVVKADQIASKIFEHDTTIKKGIAGIFSLKESDMPAMSKQEFLALPEFIKSHDISQTPMETAQKEIAKLKNSSANRSAKTITENPKAKTKTVDTPKAQKVNLCSKCSSENITMLYGKYGYYFKCNDCSGNTSPVKTCPNCGQKAKIRKSKSNFFIECANCESSELFHSNNS